MAWVIAAILVCGTSLSSEAAERAASFIIDANTGAVVSAYKADEPRYPASLTKMMTMYVAFDLLQQGRLAETTRIRISPHAASAQPTKLGLEPGDDIALIDAIKSLVTLSANDIAIAIAEHIAGTEERFAALMTQKARAIGMRNTTFKNASGLPNSEQVTTARDMVTLGMRLHDDFPKYYVLFATRDFRYAGRTHPNHNTLLNNYEGTEGIKTGYTSASGFNLVASVKRGPRHVMGAVFGGVTANSRNQTMRTLLNIALFKASAVKTRTPVVATARARPAPEPRAEPRPQTQYASLTKPNAAPVPAWPQAQVQPLVQPQAQSTQVAASTPPPDRTVEMARVRPVLVAPRAPRQAPTVDAPAAQTAPVITPAQPVRIASAAPVAPYPQRAPIAVAPYQPSAYQPAMAAGLAPLPPQPVPARGNPPSTLQQQAAALHGGASAVARPQPVAANGVASSMTEIQIGAYATAGEAERQLALVRSKAPELLGGAQAKTQPTNAGGKPLWRARFAGFDASQAGTVCTELRRRQIDCLVTRAE